jgi:hypothetical protein
VLDGQVAIMTGGGTGISRARADAGAEGAWWWRAAQGADRGGGGEIATAGGRAVARVCDVAKPAEARARR